MTIKGVIKPLRDNVFVSDMNFGEQKTAGGLIINSDDGKRSGIHPRWGKVFAVGPEQKWIKEGDWVLVEHGRWTRTVPYEVKKGKVIELRMVETDAILCVSDEMPDGVLISNPIGPGSNVNLNIPQ
jgi:co-chaperonin GroES (HSP10)